MLVYFVIFCFYEIISLGEVIGDWSCLNGIFIYNGYIENFFLVRLFGVKVGIDIFLMC